jgi:hypothetical protein
MRAWVLALALGGCGFSSPAAPSNGGGNGQDAGDSMPPDGSGASGTPDADAVHVCLGTFVKVCADAPRGSLNLMTGMIDTSDVSTSSKCLPATAYTTEPAVDACVIAGQTIAIPSGNTVSVTGRRRLILLADETLTIAGTLDVAGHRRGLSGPAADSGPCPTNFTNPTTATEGGGGWGGTFGESGNNGGNTPGGGMGGGAGSQLPITALGGGCPGGTGANNGGGNGGGSGGHGGGAVLLLAGQSITIGGTVNASGAGGTGGKARGGGGGGGSGGMIVLEAPILKISGKCFANGGGGGEGSSGAFDGAGGGESSAPDAAGNGGASISVGGSGGAGGVGTTASKTGSNGSTITAGNPPVTDTGGGGAGGGAVGVIKILSADPGNTSDLKKVSPPPS